MVNLSQLCGTNKNQATKHKDKDQRSGGKFLVGSCLVLKAQHGLPQSLHRELGTSILNYQALLRITDWYSAKWLSSSKHLHWCTTFRRLRQRLTSSAETADAELPQSFHVP